MNDTQEEKEYQRNRVLDALVKENNMVIEIDNTIPLVALPVLEYRGAVHEKTRGSAIFTPKRNPKKKRR